MGMTTTRALAIAAVLLLASSATAGESITSQQFVDRAAELGAAELASAKLADERAESEDVKKLANETLVDHTVANDELSKIAAAKGWTLPQAAGESPEIAALHGKSGAEFDDAYVELQVRTHEELLALLEAEAAAGGDERLREWAAKQIPIARGHLEHARSLRSGEGSGPPR
jgi:putative membrane protein